MLLQQDSLLHVPIMSLQSGGELSRTDSCIIDPRQLTIVAFYCTVSEYSEPHILHVSDIREVSELGYIIDSGDKLMTLDNLVRLQTIIDLEFTIIGTRVYDDLGSKIGKVQDFSYQAEDFIIEQLFVKPSLFKDFSSTTHIIHRKQIISVTNEKIIVKSPKLESTENESHRASFANPFRRHTQPEPESFRTERISS